MAGKPLRVKFIRILRVEDPHRRISPVDVALLEASGRFFTKVTQQFPDLHWYCVYIEVERLCQSGDLRLIHKSVLPTISLN